MSSAYGESTVGTEVTALQARKCEGVQSYDGSPCGSPIHPNHFYCWRHRLEYSDKILDEFHEGSVSPEEAKEQWLRVAKNWDEVSH